MLKAQAPTAARWMGQEERNHLSRKPLHELFRLQHDRVGEVKTRIKNEQKGLNLISRASLFSFVKDKRSRFRST